ncbi:MAG: hypothetical protein IJS05_07520 [Paludibacteraceae bacterium]|nr:hypothetical protein [Paludibacteraceae bacterium]
MKKILVILISIALPLTVFADFRQEYQKGQENYKKGKYEKARDNFMNVLQEKGVYANVVEYLRLCNEKISNKSQKEISKLEIKVSNLESTQKIHERKIISLRDSIKNLKDTITEGFLIRNNLLRNIESLNKQLTDTINALKSAKSKIDELNVKISQMKEALEEQPKNNKQGKKGKKTDEEKSEKDSNTNKNSNYDSEQKDEQVQPTDSTQINSQGNPTIDGGGTSVDTRRSK